MTPDQIEAAALARSDSLATASYSGVADDAKELAFLQELREAMAPPSVANVIATEYGTRIEAPYSATAVTLLKEIGARWSTTERVWFCSSSRHDLAVRICQFVYDDTVEYEEFDGYTTAMR